MSEPFRVYLGHDARESAGSWVFMSSALKRASAPLAFVPLDKRQLGHFANLFKLPASNEFIFSRYAVAYLEGLHGKPVLFVDGADMIAFADLNRILDEWEPGHAVQVVRREPYAPTPQKFVGTPMASANYDYPRKQWSSVMLISPGHAGWRRIDFTKSDPAYWHEFGWLKDNEIGDLDPTWNVLVDEGEPLEGAKIAHWTLGVPAMHEYRNAPGASQWFAEATDALNVCCPVWQDATRFAIEEFRR